MDLETLKHLFDASPSSVFATNEKKEIVYANRRLLEENGYTFEEIQGQNPRIFRSGEQSQAMYQDLHQTIEAGQTWKGFFRNLTKEGQSHWLRSTIVPIPDAAGKTEFFLCMSENCTAARLAEEEMIRQQRFVEALLSALPNPVYVKDLEGRYQGFNEAFANLVGEQASEILGKRAGDFTPAEEAEEIERQDKEILRTLEPSVQQQTIHVSGRTHTVHFSKAPFFNTEGKPDGVVGMIVDVTELEQQRLRAEAANVAKDAFLANMSHELRTPLNAILGAFELIHDEHLGDGARELTGMAREAAQELLDKINRILLYTKLGTESYLDTAQALRLDSLKAYLESTFRAPAEAKGLTFRIEMADWAKEARIPHGPLEEILRCLVDNAIRFTGEGEVVVTLGTVEEGAGVHLQMVVEDTGIGIPQSHAEDLFQPFSQVDNSSTRVFGGLGLGLTLVKRLVQMMEGSIKASSREDRQGTRFEVVLPTHSAEAIQKPVVSLASSREN